MYLVCTVSLLLCYISWTVSMERAQTAADSGVPNQAANIAVLFFIYAYSPCYNMGYNALTYSKSRRLPILRPFATLLPAWISVGANTT